MSRAYNWMNGAEQLISDFKPEASVRGHHARLFNLNRRFRPCASTKKNVLLSWTNLLINALKYTPDESTISISTRLSEDKTRVRISISDQGPGLKDVDTNNLLSAFTKATTVVPAQESDCPILKYCRTTRRQHWSLRQQEFRKPGSHFLVRNFH